MHALEYALLFNSVVRNMVTQLIELNEYDKLEQFTLTLKSTIGRSKEYFNRLNHIYFDKPTNGMILDNIVNDVLSVPRFFLCFQAFTDIDIN